MSRIYWDTMLFAYLLEDSPNFGAPVARIYERMEIRRDRLCTSSFTLAELLVAPMKAGATEFVDMAKALFGGPDIEVIDFTTKAAESFAEIRANSGVRPADAIHLACAAVAGVDLFLTNDKRLHQLVVPGIQFIGGLDVNSL